MKARDYLEKLGELAPRVEQLARIERNRKRRLNELLPSLEAPTADDLKRLSVMTANERRLVHMVQLAVDQCATYASKASAREVRSTAVHAERLFADFTKHLKERGKRLDVQERFVEEPRAQDFHAAHVIAQMLQREDEETQRLFTRARSVFEESSQALERLLARIAERKDGPVRAMALGVLNQVRAHPFGTIASAVAVTSLSSLMVALSRDPQLAAAFNGPLSSVVVVLSCVTTIVPFARVTGEK